MSTDEKMNVNVEALFLGPKSENRKFFKDTLEFMIDEHIFWRRDFHPEDKPVVSVEEMRNESSYLQTLEKTEEALLALTSRLKQSSAPWFSARYLGHMNTDTLMSANLGYMAAMLYNPNNCAFEGSPATTAMEIEVGKQIATMLGYDKDKSWGHITSGGTVANYEGVWVARNLKSVPLAVKAVAPELVEGMDEWQLLNMSTADILDLADKVKEAGKFEEVRDHSVRGTGMNSGELGQLLVPQTRHYSWTKAVDILGIGNEHMVDVQVDSNYRMNIEHLKEVIDRLISEKKPILAVMAVVGTTEEGAIDEVHRIVELRNEYEKQGVSFYIHVDAAYGGYARTLLLDENDAIMSYDGITPRLHENGVMDQSINWPSRDVYEAYASLPLADSITIDPHKMGYIPYAAGAVAMKDRRVLDLISYFAAYVFEKTEDNPMLLGSYIMEGSKAGATAASVWTAHRAVALNMTGFGRIIGRGIEGANRFHNKLKNTDPIQIGDRTFVVEPLTVPDFNIVDFSFNEVGNTDLNWMNDLNQQMYDECSFNSCPMYAEDWITSKTDLAYESYGDAPQPFTELLGIPKSEWEEIHDVYVLRSCVLTPFIGSGPNAFDQYWDRFMETMKKKLAVVVARMDAPKKETVVSA